MSAFLTMRLLQHVPYAVFTQFLACFVVLLAQPLINIVCNVFQCNLIILSIAGQGSQRGPRRLHIKSGHSRTAHTTSVCFQLVHIHQPQLPCQASNVRNIRAFVLLKGPSSFFTLIPAIGGLPPSTCCEEPTCHTCFKTSTNLSRILISRVTDSLGRLVQR